MSELAFTATHWFFSFDYSSDSHYARQRLVLKGIQLVLKPVLFWSKWRKKTEGKLACPSSHEKMVVKMVSRELLYGFPRVLANMPWPEWSVCLPVSSLLAPKSRRSFLLAPAHLGGPREGVIKWLCVCGGLCRYFHTIHWLADRKSISLIGKLYQSSKVLFWKNEEENWGTWLMQIHH